METNRLIDKDVLSELTPQFTIISLALEGLIALSQGSMIEQEEVESVAYMFNALKCQYKNIMKDGTANP